IGAYQLTSLDRIPAHAAVSTSVALAREVSNQKAGGFVNAVLRKVAAEPSLFVPAESGEPAERLAAQHPHPVWLVHRWVERFGAGGAAEGRGGPVAFRSRRIRRARRAPGRTALASGMAGARLGRAVRRRRRGSAARGEQHPAAAHPAAGARVL